MGRQPEASGSSVPAWPQRRAANRRFTRLTAWVDVMPIGLSSTTQPCTSRLSRLKGFRGEGSSAAGGGCGVTSRRVGSFIVDLFSQVASDFWRPQQPVNSLGFIEAFIKTEANLRRKFQIYATRDLRTQFPLVAVESVEDRLGVASAERHHVNGGKPQVR